MEDIYNATSWETVARWFAAYNDAAAEAGLDLVAGITVEQDAVLCALATRATSGHPVWDGADGQEPGS